VLHGPVPLELLEFGLTATLHRLGDVTLRDVPRSPDGGVIADYRGAFTDPEALALLLNRTPGVVEHGLFPPSMVATVIVARGDEIEHRAISS
jgi:ribose 5-phosphate isomerase A